MVKETMRSALGVVCTKREVAKFSAGGLADYRENTCEWTVG